MDLLVRFPSRVLSTGFYLNHNFLADLNSLMSIARAAVSLVSRLHQASKHKV